MKTILRSNRHHYLAGASIFLIMVALIAGVVGRGGNVRGSESYTLTVNSNSGGSVTESGEGNPTYNPAIVVNLVAEADEGYYSVRWTGDVNSVGDGNAAVATITMEDDYSVTANFVSVEAGHAGMKAGDWIKLEYTFTGGASGETYPDWLKLEFLTVEGTTVTARLTQHLSDGTQQSDTTTVDIASNIEDPVLAGILIPANRTIGDSIYIAGYGNATIENEATKTYAGANRTAVYLSIWPTELEEVAYYWDKLTGVLVELSSTAPNFTAAARAAATNMWGTTTVRMPWWPWIIAGVVGAGLVIFFVRRKRAA
jgi:hypothetical protein